MATASITNPLRGEKAWAYLARQRTIRIASINEAGDIYLTPVWYVTHERAIYIPLDAGSRHGANAEAGRGVAGLVDAGEEFVTVSGIRLLGTLVPVEDQDLVGTLQDLVFEKYFYVGHPYAEHYFDFGVFAGRRYYRFAIDKMIGWDSRETTMPAVPEARVLPPFARDRLLD